MKPYLDSNIKFLCIDAVFHVQTFVWFAESGLQKFIGSYYAAVNHFFYENYWKKNDFLLEHEIPIEPIKVFKQFQYQ